MCPTVTSCDAVIGVLSRRGRASYFCVVPLACNLVPTRLDVLRDDALGCTMCKLADAGRTQVVFGVGDHDTDLLFVGEAPGQAR